MADGRWSMTREELDRVACGPDIRSAEGLSKDGKHHTVDARAAQEATVPSRRSGALGGRSNDPPERNDRGTSGGASSTSGQAERICGFCGSDQLEGGFGGYGRGFRYQSFHCRACGGITDYVLQDDVRRFFPESDRK